MTFQLMKKTFLILLFGAIAGVFSGCATGRNTLPDPTAKYEARPDQALVILMRPSGVGGAISSAIFDATGNRNELIAAIGPKEKVAYYCPPGDRLFMVISENADFMEAKLEAGKIYYAVATPRMGVWKARFSLHPFKANHAEKEFRLDSAELRQWLTACHFIRPNAASVNYGQASAADIQTRREEYAGKWAKMLETDKQWRRLTPEDGVANPLQ